MYSNHAGIYFQTDFKSARSRLVSQPQSAYDPSFRRLLAKPKPRAEIGGTMEDKEMSIRSCLSCPTHDLYAHSAPLGVQSQVFPDTSRDIPGINGRQMDVEFDLQGFAGSIRRGGRVGCNSISLYQFPWSFGPCVFA